MTAARHLQTLWLLAKGHEVAEVAGPGLRAFVSYAQRWVERLLARYNAQGPQALGDLRRRNGTSPSILRPDLLEKLVCFKRPGWIDSTAGASLGALTAAWSSLRGIAAPRPGASSGIGSFDFITK